MNTSLKNCTTIGRITNQRDSIDGTKYGVELHFMLYAKRYDSFEEALNKPCGLVVAALFLEVCVQHKNINSFSLKTENLTIRGE